MHDEALYCEECGYREGHTPDCRAFFASLTLYLNYSILHDHYLPEEAGAQGGDGNLFDLIDAWPRSEIIHLTHRSGRYIERLAV